MTSPPQDVTPARAGDEHADLSALFDATASAPGPAHLARLEARAADAPTRAHSLRPAWSRLVAALSLAGAAAATLVLAIQAPPEPVGQGPVGVSPVSVAEAPPIAPAPAPAPALAPSATDDARDGADAALDPWDDLAAGGVALFGPDADEPDLDFLGVDPLAGPDLADADLWVDVYDELLAAPPGEGLFERTL